MRKVRPVTYSMLVLGDVEVSDNRDPNGRQEENDFFAMQSMREVIRVLKKNAPTMEPQPRFLTAARAITSAQNGGPRDEPAETRVMQLFWKQYGMVLE